MAETQQKYTQKGGARPFGISCFLSGFQDGKPHLYQTEPSGAFAEWKAQCIGKKAKETREWLEENYTDGLNEEEAVNLAIKALL